MSIKLLTELHLQFLGFKGGCADWSESTLVKTAHCCKSQVAAQICSWCRVAVSVLCLFLAVPWVGLWSLLEAYPGHSHLFSENDSRANRIKTFWQNLADPL